MIMCIMGDSGAGKTTSCRTLDPSSTYFIDCDKKGLSWKGWREQYNAEKKNYYKTDDPGVVFNLIAGIDKQRPHIKLIIVDTINALMVADEMRRSKEKGYDKWVDLAACIWGIVDYGLTVRDDLCIVFMAHIQVDREDSGYQFSHIRTSGKKLDKIVLESKFPVVLLAKCVDGEHIFETKANHSTAKTPMGAFQENEIPNDLAEVIKNLAEYS